MQRDKKEKELAATARLLEVIRQGSDKESETKPTQEFEENIISPFLKRKAPFPLSKFKLGLEIAKHHCALVGLEMGLGYVRLLGFRFVKFKSEQLLEAVKFITKDLGKVDQLTIGLNDPSLIIKQIKMPRLSRRELRDAVAWEAKRYIPYELDTVAFDYQILAKKRSGMDILLVAIPQENLNRIINILYTHKIRWTITDVAPLALINAYLFNFRLIPKGTIVFFHAEAQTGFLNIYTEGETLLNRYIPIPTVKSLNEWNPVIFEIKRALTYYEDQHKQVTFAKIILSGGYADLEFKSFIKKELGIEVEIFDPWHRVQVDNQFASLLKPHKTRFSIALGLGIR